MAKVPNTHVETYEFELFHVFVLPALWFITMLGVWTAFWNIGDERALFFYTSGWVGWWLGFVGMILNSAFLFILLNSIGGILAMALVGLIQDILRIRKWMVLLYPATAIIMVILGSQELGSRGEYLRSFLAASCLSTYLLSVLFCLLGFIWLSTRQWRYS